MSSISTQKKLFGDYNRETGKADILPCTKVGREEFEASAKSDATKEVADEVLPLVLNEVAAREAGNEEEAKAWHDKYGALKKKKCRIYCFQGTRDDEHRVTSSWGLNGQYMADFDAVGDVEQKFREWADLWPELDPKKPRLSRMAAELGLTYIGKSISTRGIRVVGKCKIERGTPFENALWLGRQLMLEVTQDEKCKDLCRASFEVPWDYIEYLSDELFEYEDKEYDARYNKRKKQQADSGKVVSGKPIAESVTNAVQPEADLPSITYLGIGIDRYIAKYWELFYRGETPKQGGRNTLTFELCCDIRHIVGFDRGLMVRVIPAYDGLPESERLNIIDSALSRERGPMPYRMRMVLKAMQADYGNDPEQVARFEEAEEQEQQRIAESLRKVLPYGVKDGLCNFQPGMLIAGLTSLFPTLGAQATGVRLDIHGEGFRGLNLQVYVVGNAASNKGMMTELFMVFTVHMKERDDHQRQLEAEYNAQIRRAKNKQEQPEEKHFPQRLQSLRTSIAEILDRLQYSGGRHLLSYTSESDQLAAGQGAMWSNMSVILRCAYDGDSFSQDYKSDTSTRAWIDSVLWNVCLCGTPDALFRMFRNYTDGSITRQLIARTPDNTYAPLILRKKRSKQAVENISRLTELLPLMQGDLLLPRLEKKCQEWLERVRVESMKADDSTRARLRFRIAVSVMRCVTCLMLCDFAGWLIREIDQKEQKPAWADGCQTAMEYLQKHPEATTQWVPRKFQKRQLLDAFDLLADHYLDNALYYFRAKIEEATEKQSMMNVGLRAIRGKNDDVYTHLPHRFTLKQAQQARSDHSYDRTRSMLKNWTKAGLVKNVDTGTYEKLSD